MDKQNEKAKEYILEKEKQLNIFENKILGNNINSEVLREIIDNLDAFSFLVITLRLGYLGEKYTLGEISKILNKDVDIINDCILSVYNTYIFNNDYLNYEELDLLDIYEMYLKSKKDEFTNKYKDSLTKAELDEIYKRNYIPNLIRNDYKDLISDRSFDRVLPYEYGMIRTSKKREDEYLFYTKDMTISKKFYLFLYYGVGIEALDIKDICVILNKKEDFVKAVLANSIEELKTNKEYELRKDKSVVNIY